jgi:hypothetical protein
MLDEKIKRIIYVHVRHRIESRRSYLSEEVKASARYRLERRASGDAGCAASPGYMA